ncbi:OmpP1/FadL family transporter [Pedobacter boryungensis]|uniref:Long-subunit fatty acid transport protein n=1 Tax=Pedobacter boryungensis TaxID=869962 RepID=A0ABX2D911_9SPHI|nr:hypothetical protein [Pedobacter boryungensis]NQX30553.1 hypothetical protein [Pedobacter boryungensis]
MKKFMTMLVVAIVVTTSNIYAQYASDALRFSQTNYGSTTRFKAMGNAQIGVGGDISSLGGNPAGLGLFTKSEFSLTPEFNQTGINANYLGQNTNTDKSELNVNQIGAVFFTPLYKQKGEDTKKGLISAVFGLGYNRTNDYSGEINYGGSNNKNSIADYFAELGGSTSPNNLASGGLETMAYNNYLISYDNVANNYYPETFADNAQSNAQRKNEIRSGSVSEFNFSGAANVSNQFYIGASIGLVDIKYNSDAQYEESGKAREYDGTGNLTGANINYKLLFNQSQTTKGSGVNARLGVIFRAAEGLRLGATIQTPTWFVIDDSYTEGLDNRGTIRGTTESKTYDFTYNLRTPLKGSFGASYIIGGQAIISADVDFIDYASTRFSTDNSADNALISSNNADVRNNYKSAVNYRVGAEYKLQNISLRAGYGLNGSPYKSDSDGFFDTKMYSGGLGYRVNNYYIDLAYQRVEVENSFSPYTLNNGTEPVAAIKNTKDNVFLTIGLRF